MKLIKLNGKVINVGDWDYCLTDEGVVTNPLPEGAVEVEGEWPMVEIPRSVTPLQMRKALRASGLKATVDAALAAAPEDVREEWEYATEILRDNATLDAMAHALGKTDAEIDALFQLAATF